MVRVGKTVARPGLPAEEWEITLATLAGGTFNRKGCWAEPTRINARSTEHVWEGEVRRLGPTFYRYCDYCKVWRWYLV